MHTPRSFPPIVRQVVVKALAERAFARFTDEIHTRWPLASHSVLEGEAESLSFEGRVGGRIVERGPDGRECVWGTVVAWEPPRRVAFTWHPGREAGHQARLRPEPARAPPEYSAGPRGSRTAPTAPASPRALGGDGGALDAAAQKEPARERAVGPEPARRQNLPGRKAGFSGNWR